VAVSLQEGAEKAVTKILETIGSDMDFQGKKLELRASTFAGKPEWDRGDPVHGVDGFTEHTSLPIKEGFLEKESLRLKQWRKRFVVLTSRQLLTFDVKDEEEPDFTKDATNALWIPLDKYVVAPDGQYFCLTVQGKEGKKTQKQAQITFRLCADDESEMSAWQQAIAKANEQAFQSSMRFGLPFHNGVSLAILSADAPSDIKLFSLDFSKIDCGGRPCTNFATKIKNSAVRKVRRTFTPTTADKGGAIARIVFNGRAICFAANHLDASKHETRKFQAEHMMLALSKLDCEAEVWMGDFNTRPTQLDAAGNAVSKCCPWPEVELAVSHMAPNKAREAVLQWDDMKYMVPPTHQYQEMPISFPATFHKRYRRQAKDECSKLTPKKELLDSPPSTPVGLVATGGLWLDNQGGHLSHDWLFVQDTSSIDHILKANEFWKADSPDKTCKPTSDIVCWAGTEIRESCQESGCFNTHKASHCPGYTDRVLFKPGNGILEPCSYGSGQADRTAALADHNAVIASFKLGMHAVS